MLTEVLVTLLAAAAVAYLLYRYSPYTGVKLMLGGIGLMVFISTAIGEKLASGLGVLLSVFGFAIVIAGLLKRS